MFHDSLRVIDEPKNERNSNFGLVPKKAILVDIYRQSLLIDYLVLTHYYSAKQVFAAKSERVG